MRMVVGNIKDILANRAMPDQRLGWDPKAQSFNLPFTIEQREDIHIHWQDTRLEMDASDFDSFAEAVAKAREAWIKAGRPHKMEKTARRATWPGEESLDFRKDRDVKKDPFGRLRHHFRRFPRTESGKLNRDSVLQIELQANEQVHLHYRNLRIEMGIGTMIQWGQCLADAVMKLRHAAEDSQSLAEKRGK
jgi:hypothetical protein